MANLPSPQKELSTASIHSLSMPIASPSEYLSNNQAEGLGQATLAEPLTGPLAEPLVGPPAGKIAGKLIVLAGPSGVGKGTLLSRLRQQHPELQVSISATTRQPRPGEIDGQHYYFVSRDRFQEMINTHQLLEWAEFAGNCYGTPKAPIESAIAQGKQVILEIELLGARQVRQSFPEALQIFVMPPSTETLEERIRGRAQDSEAAIAKRLAQAQVELAAASEFDIQIVNDDIETALAELESTLFQ
jgi:guanylate kinase